MRRGISGSMVVVDSTRPEHPVRLTTCGNSNPKFSHGQIYLGVHIRAGHPILVSKSPLVINGAAHEMHRLLPACSLRVVTLTMSADQATPDHRPVAIQRWL